jgi:hypothetical protein
MRNLLKISLIINLLFAVVSCSNKENSELLVVPVDTEQNYSLPMSEIADEIKSVELEITDESPITSIAQVLICDNYIVILNRQLTGSNILLFNNDGKFIRQIGSMGQGPGEYTNLGGIIADIQNKRIIVHSGNKLLYYDFAGNFIKELSSKQFNTMFALLRYVYYINNEIWSVGATVETGDNGFYSRTVLYKENNDLQITDSIDIRKVDVDRFGFIGLPFSDYITYNNKDVYLYYPEGNEEPVLRDTLYRIKDNQLIPYLKLEFKDGGIASGKKFINLYNIYKSSRFVFSAYRKRDNNYRFCYDTKTGKGYNMKDGYTDDIFNTPKKVTIRPLGSDPEIFFYYYTDMDKAVGLEEPNPTLYIGRLKK